MSELPETTSASDTIADINHELVDDLHRRAGTLLSQQSRQVRTERGTELAGESREEAGRAHIKTAIREHRATVVDAGQKPLTPPVEQAYARAVFARMFGAADLGRLLERPGLENIDINGHDNVWLDYDDGRRARSEPVGRSNDDLIKMVQTLAAHAGQSARAWDPANPVIDLRLPDGSRLSGIMLATAKPSLSIRKHRYMDVTLKDLVRTGTMSSEVSEFLSAAVRAKLNIMVCGETNSGKTTLLRALTREFDPLERVMTVEKARELGLDHNPERFPNVVVLEEVLPNSEGAGAIGLPTLVRQSLRMHPDRIIVGEVLGDEIVTMLNAMTQGNRGSLSTIHSYSARYAFERISTYAIQAPERLPFEVSGRLTAGALDLIVYLQRDRNRDAGLRSIREILEVNGYNEGGGVASSSLYIDDGTGTATRDRAVAISSRRLAELEETGWRDGGGRR